MTATASGVTFYSSAAADACMCRPIKSLLSLTVKSTIKMVIALQNFLIKCVSFHSQKYKFTTIKVVNCFETHITSGF